MANSAEYIRADPGLRSVFLKDSIVRINVSNWSHYIEPANLGYNYNTSQQYWRIKCLRSRGVEGEKGNLSFTQFATIILTILGIPAAGHGGGVEGRRRLHAPGPRQHTGNSSGEGSQEDRPKNAG